LSSAEGLAKISDWLSAYPDTSIVHLTIGANDLNVTPETAGTDHEAQVHAAITGNVETVVEHLLALRPDLRIYWSSYDFFRPRLNFGTPAEMNAIYLNFNEACAEFARTEGAALTYGDMYGSMQVAFGFDGVQHSQYDPSFAIPPGDPSLPDPQWPSPAAAFPARDREHLNEDGWMALAEAQYETYYGPLLDGTDWQINAGLNDAWYDPATRGQGFVITVFPEMQQMFVAWFTYDTERPPEDVEAVLGEPGHRWLTAQGPYSGDTATLTLYVTEGGVFDAAEPPAQNDGIGDGTMTITFANCSEGLITYQMSSPEIGGEIAIERITDDNVALCEALADQ
jgi:lysophospholipase L1-like esterase